MRAGQGSGAEQGKAGRPRPGRMGSGQGRERVGFVLASLHVGASLEVWPAVAREAEKADVDLFCFPGGRIGLRAGHEASRNAAYELAARAPLDGILVWSSSLCGTADAAEVDRFIDRYRDLPLVSLSTGVTGVPLVSIDYYQGMRDAVRHVIRVHGFRQLAFLRGPDGHPGAAERWQAFVDGLEEAGIEPSPELVSSPAAWDEGRKAVLELLDGRSLLPGRDFRVLLTASDLMALEAVKTLESRGYRIPEDVAVIGMNDSVEARLCTPALTTVRGPFAELGALGLRRLLEAIASAAAGEDPGTGADSLLTLPATLVVRQSCGCPPRGREATPASAKAGIGAPPTQVGPAGILRQGEGPLEAVETLRSALELSPERARDWLAPLVESWREALEGGREERFFELLGRVVDRASRGGLEPSVWQEALSILRRLDLPRLADPALLRMEALVGRARLLVAEETARAAVLRSWVEERRAEELRSLDHELLMAFEPGSLGAALRARLPAIGITNAWVCGYLEGEGPSGRARLLLCLRDGELVEGDGRTFPAEGLLPEELFPERRFACVVEPLFFHESPLGYAIFEIGPRSGAVYEELRDSIGGALRSLLLFSRLEEARLRAERADEAKTTLVSNVTHELRAPVNRLLKGIEALVAEGPGEEGIRELLAMKSAAEQQIRLVNDLLDLSRAELDELDLDPLLGDPGELARRAFEDFAPKSGPGPVWRLELPQRLPRLLLDPGRITQILANLLGNARKFTAAGSVTLSARLEPPWFVLEVADTGRGIPAGQLRRVFEPFVSAGSDQGGAAGVGLGLAISRHIAELHGGRLEARSEFGRGSTFSLSLPLPDLAGRFSRRPGEGGGSEEGEAGEEGMADGAEDCILLLAEAGAVDPEIEAAVAGLGLPLRRLGLAELEGGALETLNPRALVLDLGRAGAPERGSFRRLRRNSRLRALPFLLFGPAARSGGPFSFLEKGGAQRNLADAILLSSGEGGDAPFLLVDDDLEERAALRGTLHRLFPGATVLEAADGEEAWALACETRPRLAILDVLMPRLSGLDLAERFRSDPRFLGLPLIVRTSRPISLEDAARVEGFSRVVLQNRSAWNDEELGSGIARLEGGNEPLPAPSGALVKRAVAWMNQHYSGAITRWKLAEAVNLSEDYLSRIFRKELGITPWEYLTRLRVERAKELLRAGGASVAAVGESVGFPDQAYFSRVFRKVTGKSPQAWRENR